MPTRPALKLAFDRRLRALGAGLSARLDQDAEALHRARVASRRLRAALPLLEPGNGKEAPNRRELATANKEIRRLTEALGRVREMDVALAIVRELGARRPDLAAGTQAIRAAIERDRATHLATLRDRVSAGRLRKLSRFLAEAATRSDQAGASRRGVPGIQRLAGRLAAAVERAGVLYAIDRLHEVRIVAKKLRYALELEDEIGGRSMDKWLSTVKRVQDVLGRLHDLEVVRSYAGAIAGAPDTPGETRSATRAIMDVLEQEIHEQHAAYLGGRDALRRIIRAARRLHASHRRRPDRADGRRPPPNGAASSTVQSMK